MEIITSSQMRAREQAAIASGRVTGLALMERAGQGVLDAIYDLWPDLSTGAPHALVLCGPGNNGGDGFVIARLMKARGWQVETCLLGDANRLPPDAASNAAAWTRLAPLRPYDLDTLKAAAKQAREAGATHWVIVDALFGIGQRAPLDAVMAPLHDLLHHSRQAGAGPAPIFVCVDVPTGFDADTGAALCAHPMPADLIVTFHRPKPIHDLPAMRDATLVVADIGLSGAT